MVDMRSVFSEAVSQIGYDSETSELTVRWIKGRISVYSGVPADLADEVMRAPSINSALNEQIKGVFPHHYA